LSTSPTNPAYEKYEPDEITVEDHSAGGRTDLRWWSCGAISYRPKFICLKPECRRLFKPFVDEEKFEYEIGRSGWRVRPRLEKTDVLRHAVKENFGRPGTKDADVRRAELLGRLKLQEEEAGDEVSAKIVWGLFSSGTGDGKLKEVSEKQENEKEATAREEDQHSGARLTRDELKELAALEPELWWEKIVGHGNDHAKRCPNCGQKGIRVGSTFRVPARSDEKAWKTLHEMVDRGEDMNAKFEFCATVDQYNEMTREANRIRSLKIHQDGWEDEKRRRLCALGIIPDKHNV